MALVRRDALKRADIIDDEMGWDCGLAIGKLSRLWQISQEDEGLSVVRRRQILDWARVRPEEADRFLDMCCRAEKVDGGDYVHFLEPRGEGRYFIVGNPEQIANLLKIKEQKSNAGHLGGKASAEARKAKDGTAVPKNARNHPSRPPATEADTEPTTEADTEADPERCFEESAEALPKRHRSASASASASALASESALASAREESPKSDPTGSDADPPPDEGADSGEDPDAAWDLKAASWLQKAVALHNPDARQVGKAKLATWAKHFRLMRQRDGLSREAIKRVLCALFEPEDPEYMQDPFWRKHIQCPATFREKWDRLTAEINNPRQRGEQRRNFF